MLKTLVDAGVRLVSKLKLISWNVNSLRAREPLVHKLIEQENPDVLCVQELKIDDQEYVDSFFTPYDYQTISQTQKSYNGVSISIKKQIGFKELNLSKLNDHQARNNTVIFEEKNIVLLNNYFPNGNPIDSEKFDFKKTWMNDLYNEIKTLKAKYRIIITGDFNVIPEDEDAHDIKKYKNDALAQPESRREFYKYLNLDLLDVFENQPKNQSYTFFDYKTYKFGKEEGIRIDFFLTSPFLKSRVMNVKVLKEYRDMERPSDHCPIMMQLNI